MLTAITFIIILLVVILIHEWGHFYAAKRSGIRVDEFGFGFPPKLFGKKFGETEYTFNLLPIGGFVRIFGENPNDPALDGPDGSRSFVRKPKWIQAIVLVAGVVMNFVLAWVLFMAVFVIGAPYSVNNGIPTGGTIENPLLTITYVAPEAPAENAGLRTGDKIISLQSGDSEPLLSPTSADVQQFVEAHADSAISVEYQRGGANGTAVMLPEMSEALGRPVIGIAMDMVGTLKLPFLVALVEGTKYTFQITGTVAVELFGFFKNVITSQADFGQVAGPVGLAGIVGSAAELGIVSTLILTAVISINLGIINLLPVPALDGGRLLFLGIETIIRRPIKPQVAQTVNSLGFFLLIALMVVITYHDILGLF